MPLAVIGGNAQPVALYDAHGAPIGLANLTSINAAITMPIFALDAFARQRVVQPEVIFSSSMEYDAAPLQWQSIVSGANNAATYDSAKRQMTMTLGGTNAGHVVHQSTLYTPYQPGRSTFITMTGVMGAAVTNVTQRIGYFDSANGLFFQQTSAGKAVVRRSSVSGAAVDVVVAQSNWNIDPLDGSGASGYTLDWTKDQIFVIDFAWLGTARVRFGFYLGGDIVYCHAMDHANVLTTSYMQSGTLPLRYELSCAAPASATMVQICGAIASEGGYFSQPGYQFSAARAVGSLISTASEVPLIAVRPALTYNSIPNRVQIRITHLNTLATTNSIIWRVLYYPPGSANPVTGGTWVQPDNSASEFNVSGTALSLTGAIAIFDGYTPAASGGSAENTDDNIPLFYPLSLDAAGVGNILTTNIGANPAYIVVSGLGAGATAGATLSITEVRS